MDKNKTLSIRLTETEWAAINERCVQAKMTLTSFAKLAVLGFVVENPKKILESVNHLTIAEIMEYVVKTTPVIAPVTTEQVLVIDTANTYLAEIRELLKDGTSQNDQLLEDINGLHKIIVYLEDTK